MPHLGPCWEWKRGDSPMAPWDYGAFLIGKGSPYQAHRISYKLHFGDVPLELSVMHMCDNRACVNPSHLTVGTAKDNAQDKMRKGRWKN